MPNPIFCCVAGHMTLRKGAAMASCAKPDVVAERPLLLIASELPLSVSVVNQVINPLNRSHTVR